MDSAVVGGIVFRRSIFFLGEIRQTGDRSEEPRRHIHSRGSITWTAKLSASPGTVGSRYQLYPVAAVCDRRPRPAIESAVIDRRYRKLFGQNSVWEWTLS